MKRAFKPDKSIGHGLMGILQRELGDVSPRSFAHRLGASEDLVMRYQIQRKLDKHRGCVNTIGFNSDGSILISGSDDKMVILWNWDAGVPKLSFHSGHSNNVFQARFMPCKDDRAIVTCAADGEVRHAQLLDGGEVDTTLLGQHDGRAHKLAIEPGSPYIFYSCGEDGLVQHFDLRTKSATKLFICKSFESQNLAVPLNAIIIDPRNPNLFSIGGTDEYARVYDIRKYKWDSSTDNCLTDCFCPHHLIGDGNVGITGLAFSDQSELLISYNDENIYLFSKYQGLGSDPLKASTHGILDNDNGAETKSSSSSLADGEQNQPVVYKGHQNRETVKGVSFCGPNCEYVTSGSDCGRVFIWRKRDAKLLRAMEGDKYIVNCIVSHPYATMLATSGIESDVKIWIPNATEPAPPLSLNEIKLNRRRKSRFRRFILPEDMIAQLLTLQRLRSRAGDGAGSSELASLLVNLVDGDGSSDNGEDGDSSESPGDCLVS